MFNSDSMCFPGPVWCSGISHLEQRPDIQIRKLSLVGVKGCLDVYPRSLSDSVSFPYFDGVTFMEDRRHGRCSVRGIKTSEGRLIFSWGVAAS